MWTCGASNQAILIFKNYQEYFNRIDYFIKHKDKKDSFICKRSECIQETGATLKISIVHFEWMIKIKVFKLYEAMC